MGRLIVLLLATMTVWGSGAFMFVVAAPDPFISLVVAVAAFLSTGVIWGVGSTMDRPRQNEAIRPQTAGWDHGKPKRTSGATSLTSVVDDLTPEQIAALEIALQRRRELYDEDEQILANRLSVELERASQR